MTKRGTEEAPSDEEELDEVTSDEVTEKNRPNTAPTICSTEELDAMYKKVQEEFNVFKDQYDFPDDMSKNGKKKLLKTLKFDFFKPIRRKIEREKLKRKKANNPASAPKRRKGNKLCDSNNKLRVAVDCSFDDLMTEKDIVKLSKQIQRIYAMNRHMENPLQLHLTNMQGKTLERMGHVDGYLNWDINLKSESLNELFEPSDVVYLCAESENLLSTFDDSKTYVIGGFVDHNAHKGLAYERAQAAGFQHARLPIDQFFTLSTRKVLTVCHVFEIISNFCVSNSWSSAIEKTVPERKGLKSLDDETKSEETEALKSDDDVKAES